MNWPFFRPLQEESEKILVKEGDWVRKGQKLMDLSSAERASFRGGENRTNQKIAKVELDV